MLQNLTYEIYFSNGGEKPAQGARLKVQGKKTKNLI